MTYISGGIYRRGSCVFAWVLALVFFILQPVAALPSDPDLRLSPAPDRSSDVALDGQTLSGDVFVFALPETDVTRVRFYIDDPGRSGPPTKTERAAPFDLGGTAPSGLAIPFDTTSLADGQHTITAELRRADGSTQLVSAQVTVENTGTALQFSPESMAFTMSSTDPIRSESADLSSSAGSSVAPSVSSSQTWLTVTSVPASTPGTVSFDIDASGLSEGTHVATLLATAEGHVNATLDVTLSVTAGGTPAHVLEVSSSPDRSSPGGLDGATVGGDVYVFVSPATGIDRARFYLDDPGRSGSPIQTERSAPYDMAGGTVASANAFDTTTLVDGEHTVTVAIEKPGGLTTIHATFTVANGAPAVSFTPDQLTVSADPGGAPSDHALDVTTTDGSPTTVSLSASDPWVSLSSSSVSSPGSVVLTLDPAGLPEGSHSATVTGSATGYITGVVNVTLNVGAGGSTWSINRSPAPDRGTPSSLDGATVAGSLYAFVLPSDGPDRIRWYVDDPGASGPPVQTENYAPWDLQGGSATAANPFDTTSLADGTHTITAVIEHSGPDVVLTATITVANGAPSLVADPATVTATVDEGASPVDEPLALSTSDGGSASASVSTSESWIGISDPSPSLPASITLTLDPTGLPPGDHDGNVLVTAPGYLEVTVPVVLTVGAGSGYVIERSASSDRSSPTPLDGATVAGDLYAFLAPESGPNRVRWYVDDPGRSGPPVQTENSAPWDLQGGSPSTANPFDTATLTDGNHTVTAVIEQAGADAVVHATFAVANGPGQVSATPSSLTLNSSDGTTPASDSLQLTTSGTAADVTLTSDEPWLTASPTAGTTPLSVTVTADPAGLGDGTYSGTITVSSPTHGGTSIPVSFTVGSSGDCGLVPCESIMVSLPYSLDWMSDHGFLSDGSGTGTGFTWIDEPTNGSGYVPGNLTADAAAGQLQVLTTDGIASDGANSQDNALAVGIDAPNQVTVIEVTVDDVPAGSGGYEQAGLWFGNDEDDYVKLTVQSAPSGLRVEHRVEVDGTQSDKKDSGPQSLLGKDVTLRLELDPTVRTTKASYRVDGGPQFSLGEFTLPGAFFSFDAAGIDPRIGTRSFGGVSATHRNGPSALTYAFSDFSITEGIVTPPPASLSFDRVSASVSMPTAMAWGPDDRLYVTELFGDIHALTFDANWNVIADDVYSPIGTRLTLGIAVDPSSTPSDVELWLSHSSPSLDDGEVNSSMMTKVSGPGFSTVDDVITGLPRAKANHAPNSIHFGPDGRLYIASGGSTGAGAPNLENTEFGDRPEQPLSAALLVADVNAPGFQGDCATPLYAFGVPSSCDVEVFSSGLRNTYDFVHHTNGFIYAPDNGLGVTGTYPPSTSPDCTGLADASQHNPGAQPDILNLLEEGLYYGHPNPYRDECVFKDGSWQSAAPLPNYTQPIADLGMNRSANGTVEYTGGAFCGELAGDLLIANYSVGDDITRIRLSADGRSVVDSETLLSGFDDPLPLALGPDGVVFVGEFGSSEVTVLVPESVGCWTNGPDHPEEILDAVGASLDGLVYVVAGKTSSGPRSTVDVLDPATGTWTTTDPLPGPAVENPAVVAADGKLFAFGGSTTPFAGAVDQAASYDPATGSWTVLAPMPTPRAGATAAVLGDEIHVIGGMGADGASVDTVEIYDVSSGSWSTGTPMLERRDNPGSAVLDGTIYVFGGRTRNADGSTVDGTLASVEAFDPASGTWSPRAPMPTGRRTFGVGVVGGKAYVIGGEKRSDGGSFDENERYDPSTDSWAAMPSMPFGRHGAAAATVGNRIYMVGGGPVGGGTFSSSTYVFDIP